MDVLTAIHTRRSLPCDPDKPIEPHLLEQILKAGAAAPQHKRTAPWRWRLFANNDRQILQQAWEEGQTAAGLSIDAVKNKTYRAPVIIAVWSAIGRSDKPVPAWEEHAAVAAAIQNMLLAAHALGLAAFWRSGPMVDYPAVHKLCTMNNDTLTPAKGDRLMAMIYIGHPQKA
jgi:nitroreductase